MVAVAERAVERRRSAERRSPDEKLWLAASKVSTREDCGRGEEVRGKRHWVKEWEAELDEDEEDEGGR